MLLIENFAKLLTRFRYPVSLPEDVARDLGLHLPNSLSFNAFMEALASPNLKPKTLKKGMPRYKAESVFISAVRQEIFKTTSLFSYKFSQGWVVIALYFTEDSLLGRLNLFSPHYEIDLHLEQDDFNRPLAISSLHPES